MTNDTPRYIVTVVDRMDESVEYTVSDSNILALLSTFNSLTVLSIQDVNTSLTTIYFIEPGMKIHVIPLKLQ